MIAKTKQSSLTRNMCQSCQIVTIHHSKHIRACYIRTLDDFLIKANFPFIFICKSKKAEVQKAKPICICQHSKLLPFTLLHHLHLLICLLVTKKIQKYKFANIEKYFKECCLKLRDSFSLKVPRYLPIICCLALLSLIPALWKPHGNTFVITKTNICRIRPTLHTAWISDLAKTQICVAES